MLRTHSYDWICLTSPEAASVFLRAWQEAGRPGGLRVAVVGDGTGVVLTEAEGEALAPQFVPSAVSATCYYLWPRYHSRGQWVRKLGRAFVHPPALSFKDTFLEGVCSWGREVGQHMLGARLQICETLYRHAVRPAAHPVPLANVPYMAAR